MPETTTLAKTAQTYGRDLAERVIWTFLAAAGGVALAAGPADMFHASLWQTVGTAGIAAVGSLLKGVAARVIGDKNSASTASSV
ncbi:MAG: hypothetical protein LBV60_00775 [Streptomyces sp.]|jgi:hypothetical protein|nr:hypothetical protein [Streptomyces sp.]